MSQTTERLRTQAQSLRRKPTPLADLVPLLLKAADDLDGKDALLRMAMEAMLNLRKGAVAVWALGGSHETEQAIASIEAELSQSPAPVAVQPSQWQDIATAPEGTREMFVVKAFNVCNGFTGSKPYTSDPWCVWRESDGGFARWPHHFPPTHWHELPPLSASPEDKPK